MNSSTQLSRRAMLAALGIPLVARRGDAQPPELPDFELPKPIPRAPGDTVAERLAKATWRTAERGPLLIVAPEAIRDELLDKIGLAPRGGDRLIELAPRLDRKLTRVGGLWTLTPTTLPTLAPESDGVESGTLIALAFLDAMGDSASQLASPDGVSRAQLGSPALRAMFDRLVPETIDIPRRRLPDDFEPPEGGGDDEHAPKPQLPAAASADLRLHAYWYVSLIPQAGSRLTVGVPWVRLDRNTRPTGPYVTFALRPPTASADDRQKRPFAHKLSDLPYSFETLDRPVTLTGAATVAQLIERIARISGLNLIVDRRIGKYSVQVRGESARAGDALDAICRALGGSVRRLPPDDSGRSLFVLTEDRVPRSVRIQRAVLEVLGAERVRSAPLRATGQRLQARLHRSGPDSLPFPLPDSLTGKLKKAAFSPGDLDPGVLAVGAPVSASDLTADIMVQVRAAWSRAQQRRPADLPSLPAEPNIHIHAALVIEARLPALEGREIVTILQINNLIGVPVAPPIALPPNVPLRTLLTRPTVSDPQSKALVRAAKAAGFTELSIALGGDPAHDPVFAALSRIASSHGLGVAPVIFPLAATPASPPNARERDCLGRSMAEVASDPQVIALSRLSRTIATIRDWLASADALLPERVDVDAVAKRLARLAALPGVTGIGLEASRGLGRLVGQESLWLGGPAIPDRRAMVERDSMDPADVGVLWRDSPALTAISEDWEADKSWRAQRVEQMRVFGNRLADALGRVSISKPIRVLPGPRAPGWDNWESYRGAASLMPESNSDRVANQPQRPGLQPSRVHLSLLVGIELPILIRFDEAYPDDSVADAEILEMCLVRWFDQWWQPNNNLPDGFVLDLSDRRVDAAIEFVKARLRSPFKTNAAP